ncbi:MAG: DUF5320 domain-containing protein [Candidatus Lokiarchaeota archaeon]|nr:DUF5320 domain-containing protein [Candidatus Lokiarchaeota archaeon]
MPGGDRTGPTRLGSMTGRGLGYCAGYDSPGYTKSPGMKLGRSWGRGWGVGYGRGFGYARGRGWGYRAPIYEPIYTPYTSGIIPKITSENQLTMLKQEKEYLESEMNGINSAIEDISKRIEELEKKE